MKPGWTEVELGEVTEPVSKRAPEGSSNNTFTYLDLSSVDQQMKEIVSPAVVPVAEAPSRARQLVEAGDVLVSTVRPNLNAVAVVPPDLDGATASTGFTVLRPRQRDLDHRYVFHWVKNPRFVASMVRLATGASYPAVSDRIVKASEIPMPPLEEQKRIAAILDKADELQAKRRAVLAHLDSLTQAIFLDMFGRFGSVNDPGPRVSVDDACDLIVDCVNRTAPTVEGPTPFKMIRTTNVRDGAVDTRNVRYVNQETFEKWNRRATPIEGDVILTREAPVGEAGILRGAESVFLGQRLMLYRPDPSKITSEYLLECFRSPDMLQQFTRHGSGSTVKHLPLPACRSFTLHLPPLAEQRRFSEAVAVIDISKSRAVTASEETGALQVSLQARAFRGEL